MKWHLLISSVLLAGIVVTSSLPVDSTALAARDASIAQQSLKSVDPGAAQPLSRLLAPGSFDKALKSSGDAVFVAEKKSKSGSSGKSKKKKKKNNQKNKGKKGKASPTKTKKKKK